MKRNSILCACIGLLVVGLLSGCFWDRRKPLLIQDVVQALSSHADEIVVYFEESVPAKPLPETVWDNTTGPIWDVAESNQIGFTQHYSGMILPLPPGLATMVTVRTRIVMPFGRNLTGVFESAVKKSFAKCSLCYDSPCFKTMTAQIKPTKVLRIKIDYFQTWEGPLNHLNLYAKGSCKVLSNDGTLLNEYPFEKAILKSKLGSIFATHSSAIDAMNRLLNEFSTELTMEIITRSFV
jgi:hypothetical protein